MENKNSNKNIIVNNNEEDEENEEDIDTIVDTEKERLLKTQLKDVLREWIDLDDRQSKLRAEVRDIGKEKKEFEEFIITWLDSQQQELIEIQNGEKIKKTVSITKPPLTPDTVQTALVELGIDAQKAGGITKLIFDNRPSKERSYLKRTKPKMKRNTSNNT